MSTAEIGAVVVVLKHTICRQVALATVNRMLMRSFDSVQYRLLFACLHIKWMFVSVFFLQQFRHDRKADTMLVEQCVTQIHKNSPQSTKNWLYTRSQSTILFHFFVLFDFHNKKAQTIHFDCDYRPKPLLLKKAPCCLKFLSGSTKARMVLMDWARGFTARVCSSDHLTYVLFWFRLCFCLDLIDHSINNVRFDKFGMLIFVHLRSSTDYGFFLLRLFKHPASQPTWPSNRFMEIYVNVYFWFSVLLISSESIVRRTPKIAPLVRACVW